MKFNLRKLRKDEIIWLYEHNCKHGHSYIEHPACYYSEAPEDAPLQEKIGILDIETTSLVATFGWTLCWAIKELDGPLYWASVTPGEIKKFDFDKRIITDFTKMMKKFDRFVVHWGKDRRHDIPFLRTRAVKHNIPFPGYGEHYVIDTWDIFKGKFRGHSNRLQAWCEFFDIPAKEHKLSPAIWHRAQVGCQKSLDHILEHCKEDVVSTEQVFKKIRHYVREGKTSF